jgi:hypothetical protein
MVKVTAPVYSLQARGWLGRYQYARLGLVSTPYPIGIFPRHLIHPSYYSPKGWTYQLRRTWHGIVWSAMRPPISAQPNTPIQYAYKQVFAAAVHAWQSLTPEQKRVYHYYRYPEKASGYNRFLRWYLKQNLKYVPSAKNFLLLEDGSKILQETGDGILLE